MNQVTIVHWKLHDEDRTFYAAFPKTMSYRDIIDKLFDRRTERVILGIVTLNLWEIGRLTVTGIAGYNKDRHLFILRRPTDTLTTKVEFPLTHDEWDSMTGPKVLCHWCKQAIENDRSQNMYVHSSHGQVECWPEMYRVATPELT